ncbi:POU domain, class 4, transcription factor 3 [Gallus gallus]|uniref:POU domain protein n=2 Tax=Phasianinae TaxID=9072 RepID=A0A1D5PDX7_CHICK|nr:POU domain, class 4, transcription factor 3 [Gallus gallus]XP_031453796.1 POU domain, class 4, transcription factor 3 [Phasianus colchicus]XP_040538474.1 POU domain, class 4, transcription factor 3 [Gallus gallus]|eukprot:XP_015149542.2 POU domain, class 4, transcription factor 3 [Gallus gallus]
MMAMNAKQPFPMHAALQEPKYSGLHAGAEAMRRVCLPAPQLQGNIFGSFDESLLARAEALAAVDIVSHAKSHPFKPDATYHAMSGVPCGPAAPAALPHPALPAPPPHPALDAELLEHLSPALALPDPPAVPAPLPPHPLGAVGHLPVAVGPPGGPAPPLPAAPCLPDVESDPRELEAFAERFKQRRIKLGVTQADVGAALANLKIPGVGSLSQSTICRFESLTLSHNNMTALRPVLQAWLEEAEAAHRDRAAKPELFAGAERKRKRTSIAAPEKRSLEAYFALQPRPSSEKIAAIAEKLDLKKNVVRVWFCNQRQKQKRMKYSAVH